MSHEGSGEARHSRETPSITAVIFDMDGLLLDSEVYWEEARRAFCASMGCGWSAADELVVKGNNSVEWARRIQATCSAALPLGEIIEGVTAGMRRLYDEQLPWLPGARETVQAVAGQMPIALASSSPISLITSVLAEAGLMDRFTVVISADEVARGKPSPDVFLAAASRLGTEPAAIAVFEDSTAGIRAAAAAGMAIVAVPNPHFPPSPEALGLAHCVLPSLLDFHLPLLRDLPSVGSP